MAVIQPTLMLDVPAPSRASLAPTGIVVIRQLQIHHRSPVGASLLAIADDPAALKWLTHRHREQAHSHIG
ncbi:hypothetical protein CS078_09705 [Pseudomonas prosekii]|uniref:Uncharacterized protein n=1 Tax=Pseudomonas prosekii TaxID=1148509 RepID=A0A3L8CBC2_9PSED|nr:hypothetical protein CS076_23210 [Pseudomonas prosekii]RLU10384.1 hypothetical protein CS078_09705 [Pseudomonas prosekii]